MKKVTIKAWFVALFLSGFAVFGQAPGPSGALESSAYIDNISVERSSTERRTLDLSAGLVLEPGDLVLEQRHDNGVHLFIRKKPGLGSVLITETTKDPLLGEHNYAYRAAEWNPVNGNEIRIINGARLSPGSRVFSLISSTVESHASLGEAFHIFVPWVLYYGNETTRHGEIRLDNGTFLNVRAFTLPYGDYRGSFYDNPFVLNVARRPENRVEYQDDAEETFREIAEFGHGTFVYSTGSDDLVEKLRSLLEKETGKSVDIVLCLDTTESMSDDIVSVKADVIPMLREITGSYTSFRLGLVLYKDYFDEYLSRVIGFTRDFSVFQRNLNAINVRGGLDMPEAVYEALHEGATQFPWEAESRIMILIGDAPPHPVERGNITKAMVDSAVQARGITVSAIILPHH